MGESCCSPTRDLRIKQYQLDEWKIRETPHRVFKSDDLLYCPNYVLKEKDGIYLFIDPESPNWISVNRTGAEIIKMCDGKNRLRDIQKAVAERYGIGDGKAEDIYKEVAEFVNAAGTIEFVSDRAFARPQYTGRDKVATPERLEELWIYVTLSCNLRCKHCLVSAGKSLEGELSKEEIIRLVDEASELGVKRFYITGGEPFMREDILEIVDYITNKKGHELIILTNAMLLDDKKVSLLKSIISPRLVIQVSLEGPNAKIHDKLRGTGSYEKALRGIKNLLKAGIVPIVSTAINKYNEDHIKETSDFLSTLGIKEHSILWMHAKGRGANNLNELFVPSDKIAQIMRDLKKEYLTEDDVIVDNMEAMKARIRAKRGRKYDLCHNCWDKICVNSDGHVYPCASLNGDKNFDAGSIRERSLKDIWLNSEVMNRCRTNTVLNKPECGTCYLRYFCGGGCQSHSYYASEVDTGKGMIEAQDPYCSTYKTLYEDALWSLASEGVYLKETDGYNTPTVFNAMDAKLPSYLANGFKSKDRRFDVGCHHCTCVLSVNVEGDEEVCKPEIKGHVTKTVKLKFSKAAKDPVTDYYCPTGYDPKDLEHIPNEVLEVSYGCGNPAALAGIKEGETILDLGSGGGIDCFIAAKKVGRNGRVIGVDMTDEMVEKATESAKKVADVLGYNVVEFKKGNIMELPAEDNSVDLVISNCVINLTEDKAKVIEEIFRVLRPGGRFIISDIVSDKPVPGYMKRDKELWNACISGALTDKRFLEIAKQAGFSDVTMTRNYLYKKVEYISFYSVTLKGNKPLQQVHSCCG
jgi:radical SAM protein with 4Fe4S-binding SPASM domain